MDINTAITTIERQIEACTQYGQLQATEAYADKLLDESGAGPDHREQITRSLQVQAVAIQIQIHQLSRNIL